MVEDLHAERERGLARQVAPDAAHAQDPQRLAARVMALVGLSVSLLPVVVVAAAPPPRPKAAQPDRQIPQAAQHEPEGQVRSRVVDGVGRVAHADAPGRARRDIDAVVAGAVVTYVL